MENGTKQPRDFLGELIAVGDKIVYPVRRGSVMQLWWMRVETISTQDEQVVLSGYRPDGRRVKTSILKNVIRVQ